MNIYSYDIMDDDKGIIIADTMDTAIAIFQKQYPNVQIVDCRTSKNEAEIHCMGEVQKNELYCNVVW